MPQLSINTGKVKDYIAQHAHAGRDSLLPDTRAALYYQGCGQMLWVDRMLTDERADTLLRVLWQANAQAGVDTRLFDTQQIASDLDRLHTLDFDEANDVSTVVARLELMLTRAWLRYTSGLRYGFVNPNRLLNTIDPEKVDSTGRPKAGYKRLFDIDLERPTAKFYAEAIDAAHSVATMRAMLDTIEPRTPMYAQLRTMLASDPADSKRIMANMERCRWRARRPVPEQGKYVVVNIPAYHLYAYGGDSLLDMRIGCGKRATKTPLLHSEIEYMQVNPEWGIPQSIIDTDVARHAGDSAYFARNRYYIAERATGQKVDIRSVTRGMLLSGRYRVNQEGGPGNSLGRLIFRFKNNFSVYLHDTSTPGFFRNDVRSVSHGCVRIQKPFDFACYLLGDADEWTLDRIRISIDMPPVTKQGRRHVQRHASDEKEEREKAMRMIRYLPVTPHVPLFIEYYTIYPDASGQMQRYSDIYGYDDVISKRLTGI